MISIHVLTYNQVAYIEDCLNSILQQECSQPFEIVVGDDCSTDGTSDICRRIAKEHFNLKYVRHDPQKGPGGNFYDTLIRCSGEYIAFCEGDDYWVDNRKLEKQFCFLRENPEFIGVFHECYVQEGDEKRMHEYWEKPEVSFEDFVWGFNGIQWCTVFLRKFSLPKKAYFQCVAGDFFILSLMLSKGKMKRLEFYGAVYRKGVGQWSTLTVEEQTKRFLETKEATIKGLISIGNFQKAREFLQINRMKYRVNDMNDLKKYGFLFFCFQHAKKFLPFWKKYINFSADPTND